MDLPSALYNLLDLSTVKLTSVNSRAWGTGFFVASEKIITCAHVVDDLKAETITVQWKGQQWATAKVEKKYPHPIDLALLQVEFWEGEHPPCVLLGEEVKPWDRLYAHGYPDGFPDGAPVTIECEGFVKEQGMNLLKAKLGQVIPGHSGSPALNKETGKVCAIISETLGRHDSRGGLLIPISVAFTQFPELRECNGRVHKEDRRWLELINQQVLLVDLQPEVFPAKEEDEAKLLRARDMIVRWRSQYVDKATLLRTASEQARGWIAHPPKFDDQVYKVITLAERVAENFQALPIHELEFARSYGLMVHPTVFWGQAIATVLSQAPLFAAEARVNRSRISGISQEEDVPSQYVFEMIARVLESALALTHFKINELPQGYLAQTGQPVLRDLSSYRQLLTARFDNEPGLQLIDVERGIERIGSFIARKPSLYTLCAHRNQEGSLDLVAEDSDHLYYWQRSAKLPTMEFPIKERILDACFLSSKPGASVAIIDAKGNVKIITPDGKCETLQKSFEEKSLKAARIWIDPLRKEDWYLIALTQEDEVISGLHGTFSSTRLKHELWSDSVFQDKFIYKECGTTLLNLKLSSLAGLPCLILEGHTKIGYPETGIFFLDPITLESIHPPLAICSEPISTLTIAADRWLVVGKLRGGSSNRILIWDLDSDSHDPAGGWFDEDQGDIHYLTVVTESNNSFHTVQVFHNTSDRSRTLCQFYWPSRSVETIRKFADLKIWPVTD